MKTIVQLKLLVLPLLLFAIVAGCNTANKTEKASTGEVTNDTEARKEQGQAFIKNDVSTPTVLSIAIGSPDHKTLVAAVQAADLENALVNAGPLMVFAPTDEAFAALP